MKLEQTIAPFRDMLSVERGLSENTINSYVLDVTNFLKWETSPKEESFREYVRAKKYSLSTISRKVAALSSWLAFCDEELQIRLRIDLPKLGSANRIPTVLSNNDLSKITKYLSQGQSSFSVKMLAIIEFLYSTGVRVSELISIRNDQWEQIKSQKQCTVVGKGNKERIVFIKNSAIHAVEVYLGRCHVPSSYLFRTRTGAKLTRQSIHRQLKLVAQRAKVPPDRVFPHSFRHRLGSNLNQRGMNLAEIKEILGHSQIKTTLVYTHLEDEWVVETVQNTHPLAGLKAE